MSYGLLSTGFIAKTMEVIREEISDEYRGEYGSSLDLSDRDPTGQHIAIISERLAILWELLSEIVASQDPDSAVDVYLEAISSISGTIRKVATPSTVTLRLMGTVGTIVTSGSEVSVDTTGDRFVTLTDSAAFANASAWVGSTSYSVGDIRRNGGNQYIATTAGTSASSGGPTGTSTSITDGTVTWRFLGAGDAFANVAAESDNTGPVVGAAYDITTIESPAAGWDSVTNLLDAALGTNRETNEELRIRRVEELQRAGTSPLDAIRVDLLDVDGVTAVRMFENTSDATDADGMPPHTIEALVQGGTDAAVAAQLYASKAGGIGTHGTETETVTDSQGNEHTIKFSRPAEIDIYVAVTLTYDADLYPSDGDDQVKAAVVAWGDAQTTGKDVVASAIKAQAFSVDGVLDVTLAYIGTAPAPSSETTIAISTRQLAVYDTSRITVSSSGATP